MGSFIFLGIIILLSLSSLIRVAGVWSICLMVGAGCVGGGLCAGSSDCALFGLALCFFGFLSVYSLLVYSVYSRCLWRFWDCNANWCSQFCCDVWQ